MNSSPLIYISVPVLVVLLIAVMPPMQANPGRCPYCDPNYLPYPNMNAALYGYDLIRADPFSESSVGGDPGWRLPILSPTVYEDGTVRLHDSVDGRDAEQCNGETRVQEVTNLKQYKEMQLKSTSSGYDLQLGREMDVELSLSVPAGTAEVGGSASTTIPPFFTRGESSSATESSLEEFFTSKKGSMIIAEATCSVDVITVIESVVPKFNEGFKNSVVELWQAAQSADERSVSSDSDESSRAAFRTFVKSYGTHYSAETVMGSKMVYQLRITKDERLQTDINELKRCTTIKGSRITGIQVEEDSKDCEQSKVISKDIATGYMSREKFVSFGSKPNNNLEQWAQQSFSAPMPLRMNLKPILQLLFKQTNLDAIELGIELQAFTAWLVPLWENLCEVVYPGQCAERGLTTCGYTDICEWDEECVNNGECTGGAEYTQKDGQCQVNPTNRRTCDKAPEDKKYGEAMGQTGCEEADCCWAPVDLFPGPNTPTGFIAPYDCYAKMEQKPCDVSPESRIPLATETTCSTNNPSISNDYVYACNDNNYRALNIYYEKDKLSREDSYPVYCYASRQAPECSVNPSDRTACGSPDIDPKMCLEKGCCYNSYMVRDSSVRCFGKERPKACSVNPDDRVQCGWEGVTKDGCTRQGCCYNENDQLNHPSFKTCFYPSIDFFKWKEEQEQSN